MDARGRGSFNDRAAKQGHAQIVGDGQGTVADPRGERLGRKGQHRTPSYGVPRPKEQHAEGRIPDPPVEQPTVFDFVISLKTAEALGLTSPPPVLLQATEVLQ
jgi:hypothetical protein